MTADHKVSSEGCESRNNHRYAVVVQDLATQRIQSYPCKNENFWGNTKEVAKVLVLKEQCAEWKKVHLQNCCNQVWMKVGGQILWNVLTYLRNVTVYYLMGRRPMKDVLGNHLKDLLFHLVHWLSITQELRRTSQESINLERKSYLDCSSDTHCTRVEFGNDVFWLQTLRSWEIRRVRNPCSKRLKRMKISYSQSQMEQQNCLEEIMSPRIHSKKTESTWNEWRRISRKLGDVSSDRNKRWCWSQKRLLFNGFHFSSSRWFSGSSARAALKYSDVTWTTHTSLDVLQEKRFNDYHDVDVDRILSEWWTGFTKFTSLIEKLPHMFGLGRATHKDPDNYQTWSSVTWDLDSHVKSSSEERGAKNGLWRNQLDNARKLRDICFIDAKDGEEIGRSCGSDYAL